MTVIGEAILCVVASASCAYFLTTFALMSWFSRRATRVLCKESTSGDSTARIILLMPMLREDRIVRHAIGQHEQLLRCKGNIDIVVVTSEREAQEREYCIDQLARMARNEIATGEEDIRKLARIAFEGDVAKGAIDLLTGPGPDKEAALGRLLAARKRPLTETGARAAARELNGRLGRKAVHVAVSPAEMAGKVGQMNAALPLCKRLAEGRPGPVFIGVYDAELFAGPVRGSQSGTGYRRGQRKGPPAGRGLSASLVLYPQCRPL